MVWYRQQRGCSTAICRTGFLFCAMFAALQLFAGYRSASIALQTDKACICVSVCDRSGKYPADLHGHKYKTILEPIVLPIYNFFQFSKLSKPSNIPTSDLNFRIIHRIFYLFFYLPSMTSSDVLWGYKCCWFCQNHTQKCNTHWRGK